MLFFYVIIKFKIQKYLDLELRIKTDKNNILIV